jgi:hypothetical protein
MFFRWIGFQRDRLTTCGSVGPSISLKASESGFMPLERPPALPQEVETILNRAKRLADWVAARQDGLEIPNKNESKVPGALFDLTIEHHVAIVHLIHGRLNGSAFALLRAAFESLVRGAWFQLCATKEQLESFVEKDELPFTFRQLINATEGHTDFADRALSRLGHNSWSAMNSYTHSGMLQIGRRFKGKSIEPNYSPEEIIEVLKASGTFALLAMLQAARLAKNDALANEIANRLNGG